jgi:hypothetical protein
MSLFDSIKAAFGGKTSVGEAPRDTSRVYLVDAEKLAESREGRMGPQERFHAIQTLSRFAEREKLNVVAVVGGRPLREVAHGDAFNGVRVFYVEAEKTLADQMIQVLDRELRGRAVVVTNDKQLETRIQERGGSTLRLTSLRRALDSNNNGENGGGGERGDGRNRERGERNDRGERGGGDRGGRDRRDRRGPRPDRRDQPERQAQPAQGQPQPEQDNAPERAPDESRGNAPTSGDTIDNLIDRVN